MEEDDRDNSTSPYSAYAIVSRQRLMLLHSAAPSTKATCSKKLRLVCLANSQYITFGGAAQATILLEQPSLKERMTACHRVSLEPNLHGSEERLECYNLLPPESKTKLSHKQVLLCRLLGSVS